MCVNIKNIAIFTKMNNEYAKTAAYHIAKLLSDEGIITFCLTVSNNDDIPIDLSEYYALNLDMIFALGGDGTTLRALRIIPYNIPIFSINVGGHRGILSETTIENIETSILSIVRGYYHIETSIRIATAINGIDLPSSLNDVLIYRNNMTRTPTISINISDTVVNQKMDGMLISTPIGSTGHSLSMGGPIIRDNLNCFILSPIAPINQIPKLIFDSLCKVSSNYDMKLVIDGQKVYHVGKGDVVEFSGSQYKSRFVRLSKKGFRQLEKLGYE